MVQHGLGSRGPRNEFTGNPVCGDEDLTDEQLRANLGRHLPAGDAHPFDDGFYDDRRAALERVDVSLLSVATWGSVGSHLRGNVDGFPKAAAREKWLVTRESKASARRCTPRAAWVSSGGSSTTR